ncbi:SDR family NAD(P)-dependent oxidoreductase [Bacillus ndiopicus]|uniref:SDR family NAD(P)-dependent oxidoreductase n=1 Tax=Bacillus ndiopicus TaxID=1347368 RepID=UPI0005A64184|nr:SDR family oxidoreductase [Bacillus ndiopicus]
MDTGKVIIVTGAGGGMGKAVVAKLLGEGSTIVGLDMNKEAMKDIKDSKFVSQQVNLLDEEQVRDVFKATFSKFGRIDGLVNIAGIAQSATSIGDVSLEQWNRILSVNATGVFLTCKEAVHYMKKGGSGVIVNVGSVSVARPRPGLQSYIASKGAVEAFSRALAIEVSPDKIRVNVLHPGPADTNMLGQFSSVKQQEGGLNKEVFKNSVPLGELIQPDDIAEAVSYLVSDGSRMVTGASLHVDGGRGL